MDLNGAVALVTGGNGGLGQRICHALAKEGVHIAVMYAQSRDQAEGVARECPESLCKLLSPASVDERQFSRRHPWQTIAQCPTGLVFQAIRTGQPMTIRSAIRGLRRGQQCFEVLPSSTRPRAARP
jgi:shikimate 5-dehydrogenase